MQENAEHVEKRMLICPKNCFQKTVCAGTANEIQCILISKNSRTFLAKLLISSRETRGFRRTQFGEHYYIECC